jgi:hypothetical protein
MKTSKIIFISLLSIIAFLILVAVVDIRINGRKKAMNPADIKVNKQTVPSFKVLYVSNSQKVELIQNDSSFIEVTWMKDSILPNLNYTLKEDTLMISDNKLSIHSFASVKIYSTNSLKSILLKNSDINIKRFSSGRLSLDLDNSNVWFNLDKSEKSSVQALDILAKNQSIVNTSGFKVDSLGIILQNSEAKLNIFSKMIRGTLSDTSIILTFPPDEILLKKDATSQIVVTKIIHGTNTFP